MTVSLAASLAVWGFCGRLLLTLHTQGAYAVALGFWAVCGVYFYVLLWMVAGREIVTLRPDVLTVKRDILGFGRLREYDLARATNLHVVSGTDGDGRFLAFDYGAETVRFAGSEDSGPSVDEAEAQQIVHELKTTGRFRDRLA